MYDDIGVAFVLVHMLQIDGANHDAMARGGNPLGLSKGGRYDLDWSPVFWRSVYGLLASFIICVFEEVSNRDFAVCRV